MRAVPRAKSGRAISHNRLYGMRWTPAGSDTYAQYDIEHEAEDEAIQGELVLARFLNPTAFRPSDNLDHG